MLINDIADYAVEERIRPLPEDIFHHAKRAVIDWCAATAPGSIVMPASGLTEALRDDIGRGRARLFPSGTPATLKLDARWTHKSAISWPNSFTTDAAKAVP